MDYNYWHKQVMIKMGIPFTGYPMIIETEWHTLVLNENNGEFIRKDGHDLIRDNQLEKLLDNG